MKRLWLIPILCLLALPCAADDMRLARMQQAIVGSGVVTAPAAPDVPHTVYITENTIDIAYTSIPYDAGTFSTGVLDAWLNAGATTTNYVSDEYLSLGYWTGPFYDTAVFIFDVSGIPSTAEITDVSLVMSCRGGCATFANVIEIRRCLVNVDIATTTYQIYSTGNSWQSNGGVGGSDGAASSSSFAKDGANDWFVGTGAGLISDVQGWVDSSYANYGWLIVNPGTTDGDFGQFNSSNVVNGWRPYLKVEYLAYE